MGKSEAISPPSEPSHSGPEQAETQLPNKPSKRRSTCTGTTRRTKRMSGWIPQLPRLMLKSARAKTSHHPPASLLLRQFPSGWHNVDQTLSNAQLKKLKTPKKSRT